MEIKQVFFLNHDILGNSLTCAVIGGKSISLHGRVFKFKTNKIKQEFIVLWWRSGFDLSLVIRDPEIESRCRNALQGRRRDLSSQEASLILK